MGNITIIRAAEDCVNFGHTAQVYCITVEECLALVIDGFLVNCGEQYNCLRGCKHDPDYFVQIPVDGEIMIQTHFKDPGRRTPDSDPSWLHVELCGADGSVISDNRDNFIAGWVHGYNRPRNYQTFRLSGEQLSGNGVTCFTIRFYDTVNDVELCTQEFEISECPEELVAMESIRTGTDCWYDYYGLSEGAAVFNAGGEDFAYRNRIYLHGAYKYFGIEASTAETRTKEYARFFPSKPVPPFVMRYLGHKILSDADFAILDDDIDVSYDIETTGKFTPIEGSAMFLPSIEFSKECENSGNGNGCAV